MSWMTKSFLVLTTTSLVGTSLAGAGLFDQETVGERFRKALKEIEAACGKRRLEPNEVCGAVAKLKPADPLATEEGRFAHSLKIPNPVPADSGYKPGMTSLEYFDHLCKTEAGEFIYNTVQNVDGLYMMRLRESAKDDDLLQHLYAMEDPYGLAVGVRDSPQDYFVQPAIGKYQYLEIPLPLATKKREGPRYRRYYRDEKAHPGSQFPTAINGQFVQVPYVVAVEEDFKTRSRYGYTWRGITRPHDRELGIAGGELIVLDLQNNEVLAARRSFVRSGSIRNNLTGVWWLTAEKCSKESLKTDTQFINEVLKPVPSQDKLHESK
ncbi:hypothetical protein YTPLAS18_38580 [Nitrospira sp.]|nr:hypothetical protein YTPLAS18_38580 [Nitrospira sp.]